MKYQRLLSLIAVACALVLSGCTVGPDYVEPVTRTSRRVAHRGCRRPRGRRGHPPDLVDGFRR